MNKPRRYLYCVWMRFLWSIGHKLYNWCEGRRPAGGFYVKNYLTSKGSRGVSREIMEHVTTARTPLQYGKIGEERKLLIKTENVILEA